LQFYENGDWFQRTFYVVCQCLDSYFYSIQLWNRNQILCLIGLEGQVFGLLTLHVLALSTLQYAL